MARPSEGAEEEERGVAELGEGGAGDHVADFGEGGVGAEAVAFAGEAHPDVCAGGFALRSRRRGIFDGAGEGAVVDDFAADGGEAADAVECGAAEEDAAAGGSGCSRFWVGDFCGRIKHEEEEEEWGDEEALGESLGAEEDHEGGQVEILLLRRGRRGA